MSDFFLHPATCIQFNDSRYYIKNAMIGKTVVVDDLRTIKITDETIKYKIFCQMCDKKSTGEEMLAQLERYYYFTDVKIGYIETTSLCPYLCKMCPKSSNRIDRNCHTMALGIYRSIIDQLPKSIEITLHLFGDPLLDNEILEKIMYANRRDIKPSFSTNLIALPMVDFYSLPNIKVGNITISIDAMSTVEMSKIRGKTSEKQFENGLACLKLLDQIQGEFHFADSITLQSIDMKNERKGKKFIKELAEQFAQFSYFEKPFIVFPGMDGNDLKMSKKYFDNEWLWIYDLLGEKKPYRCLKPWDKKESGLLSDGSFVPCCMCYNTTMPIGDVNNESLVDILNGERYLEFRKKVFYGEDAGAICNRCVVNGEKKYHDRINDTKIEHLRKYCIDQW